MKSTIKLTDEDLRNSLERIKNLEKGKYVKDKKDGKLDQIIDWIISDSHYHGHTILIKRFKRTERGITSNQWYNIQNFVQTFEVEDKKSKIVKVFN